MQRLHWISIALALVAADLVQADRHPRRTTRVASGPVRSAPAAEVRREPVDPPPTAKPPVPPTVSNRSRSRADLLEPSHLLEGVGRGAVACFQVAAERAAVWQLVVHEVDGPVAQIFEGEGPPPGTIPWDGRLLDGGLAWSGVTYTYEMAWVDSTGVTDGAAGTPFTLPDYTRDDREGTSVLMSGQRLRPRSRGDTLAAARAALRSTAERLNRDPRPSPVRVEVLARDERSALALGEAIRTALAELLEPGGRAVDLYVGTASAAPPAGTVLITTVPLSVPSS